MLKVSDLLSGVGEHSGHPSMAEEKGWEFKASLCCFIKLEARLDHMNSCLKKEELDLWPRRQSVDLCVHEGLASVLNTECTVEGGTGHVEIG